MNDKAVVEYITNTIVFYVNGKKIEDSNVDVQWTLLQYLRTKLGLCGTKLGCGEGGCGACTVMVSKYLRDQKKIIHFPVNACLAPICSMHGLAVTTVEGIGSTKTKLHPVQERIAKAHGSQCGFCTPGIVMSMYTLLRNKSRPKMEDLDVAFQGNLCRCTGYRPILEAYRTFTEEWEITRYTNGVAQVNGACIMGDKCCKLNGSDTDEKLFNPNAFIPYHPSQEPIFPPELKTTNKYDKQYVRIQSENVTWHRPTTLAELLELKRLYPHAKIVVGNTEIGVETKFKQMVYPVLIQPSQIQEVTSITETPEGVSIGAAVTLSEIHAFLKHQLVKHADSKVRIFEAMLEMMQWFAGEQIRSVGSLGGNVMTGSPISDIIPILMAARASMEIQSATNGKRKVLLDEDFFVGYRKTIVKADEVLISIHIPFTREWQYFQAYKQARRRDDDIAIVNMAVSVIFATNTNYIEDIKLSFGGMSFKTLSAPTTERKLRGLPWDRDTVERAYTHLLEDLPLESHAPGGMVTYRRSLSLSLFFKAFLDISKKLQHFIPNLELDTREESATNYFGGKVIKSSQFFTVIPDTNQVDSLQKPIVHVSAVKQATGEALYCDDIPHQHGELYCAFVLSTKAHANILEIDPTDALNIDGVHGFVSDKDIKNGTKYWGTITYDEKIFNSDKVTSQGQIIGLVVADNQNLAQRAARMVRVKYEELEPVILSIEDAIKHESFIKSAHLRFEKGDVEAVFEKATNVVEGRSRMGGQEHFYLETQACLVIPKREDEEMEIYCSTQNPTEIAKLVCEVLGIAQNKVVVKVKRLGGGFGGKQSQAALLALPMAVAARKYNRPLRCMLDRNEDMVMTGGRHPFMMEYKVAFDDDGKILGCKAKLYNNCGYGSDLSIPVLQKSLTHFENAYKIPTCLVEGFACKTNLPSNTAFRAFGGPQGMFLAETLIERIADHLKMDENCVRERNLYKSGDLTHYNQVIVDCTLDKCWRECLKTSHYYRRKPEIQKYNRHNRYKKRGMNLIPTKFGIAYEEAFMNQGGALLLVYTDGSVLLSHGGVEMGQGLHTKMIQVASKALGISVDRIHISETATDKVPNTTPTAASSGSDLNGMAVMDACNKIKRRLEPYMKSDPNGSWEDWVKKAYFDRVSLAASGYHKTPDVGYNWDTKQGNFFNYFTFGVACTEVEVDTLTGDHQVLRTDIVMDLGESLNPAIDIGQIEGAFMQGYGLFVLEEMMYSPKGAILTRGPGTYKLPGFSDIPRELNVSLLKGVSNPRAVYSSKGVGEPPLFLGSSVMFAIKDAIRAAREERGLKGYFRLDPPATSAKIRMLCEDDITSKLPDPKPGSFQPWNIVV